MGLLLFIYFMVVLFWYWFVLLIFVPYLYLITNLDKNLYLNPFYRALNCA